MQYQEYLGWCEYFAEEPSMSMYIMDKMLAQVCYVQARCAGNKHMSRKDFELFAPRETGPTMTAEEFKRKLVKHMGFREKKQNGV